MTIKRERQEELHKHVVEVCEDGEAFQVPQYLQSETVKHLSRLCLGIDPNADIADLNPETRTELLIIMTGIRDRLFDDFEQAGS